jgi:hypothetical protein
MRKNFRAAGLFVSCLLFVQFCAAFVQFCAAADKGVLKGRVTDPTGAVVAGAMVRLEEWRRVGGKFVAHDTLLYSKEDGSFSYELLPGVYDVFVSARAFAPVAKKIEVEPGRDSVFSPKMRYDKLTKLVY